MPVQFDIVECIFSTHTRILGVLCSIPRMAHCRYSHGQETGGRRQWEGGRGQEVGGVRKEGGGRRQELPESDTDTVVNGQDEGLVSLAPWEDSQDQTPLFLSLPPSLSLFLLLSPP